MATFKHPEMLTRDDGADFDVEFSPAAAVPHSGIYRCMGCGLEVAANRGDPFPPQNHLQHGLLSGPIRWRLIVGTN